MIVIVEKHITMRSTRLRKPARFLQRTQKMRPFAPQVNLALDFKKDTPSKTKRQNQNI